MTETSRLAALEAENADLKRALGLQADADGLAALRDLGLQPAPAKLALLLYRRSGRQVTLESMRLLLPMRDTLRERESYNVFSVWVLHIRRALGSDAVETCHGVGYRLTPAGLAKLDGLLA